MKNLATEPVANKPNLKAWTLALLFAGGGTVIYFSVPSNILPYLFGFFFGYILQRSGFCFAGCFRDILLIRNANLTRALLLNVALTTLGFTLVHYLSGGNPDLSTAGRIVPVGLHTLAGGFVFGFGMVIAGSCVSGCLVRMGEGYLLQWITFLGLLGGSALGAWHFGWWNKFSIQAAPTVFLPAVVGWPAGLAIQFAAIYICLKLANLAGGHTQGTGTGLSLPGFKEIFNGPKWSYNTGAVMLAITHTLLFFFWKGTWGITTGLTSLAASLLSGIGLSPLEWEYFRSLAERGCVQYLAHPLFYLAVAMVAGSSFASLSRREFRIRYPKNGKYMFSALLGGLLMGYGSRVVMGCNIGAFLSGTASMSLHGWFFGFALLPGAYLGGKYLVHVLLD